MNPSVSLPATYAALSQATKLDEEPNPFEQSFLSSHVNSRGTRPVLPPLASIDNPAARPTMSVLKSTSRGSAPHTGESVWDPLDTCPLSPFMLAGPVWRQPHQQEETRFPAERSTDPFPSTISYSTPSCSSITSPLSQPGKPRLQRPCLLLKDERDQQHRLDCASARSSSISSQWDKNTDDGSQKCPASVTSYVAPAKSHRSSSLVFTISTHTTSSAKNSCRRSKDKRNMRKLTESDKEDKRKSFLERNRQAALKCRQRKKQWVHDLQAKIEFLTADNEKLQGEISVLQEQLYDLKTLLLEHRTCPATPHTSVDTLARPVSGMDSRSAYYYGPHDKGSTSSSTALSPRFRFAPYSHVSSAD
ncbi:hypothetical protein BX666DRAFT_2027252 [Dichotomocladium elegans]|nr:hypothetical protein BX666DRAFT_2027252 [Dichotomocladium elegans]